MVAGERRRQRRRFGQHFLRDRRVVEGIVAAIAPRDDDLLVEIGPGEGALTAPLLAATGTLHAVEVDRELAATLPARLGHPPGLTVHAADALRFDFCALCARAGKRLRVVGNLPYNISSPLLFRLLEQVTCIRDMVFLLQREVAERIVATPGSREYGRLSVMMQYRCAVRLGLRVPPGAFAPVPAVHSALVHLEPHPPPPPAEPAALAVVVRAAFGQRRKTLRNALAPVLDVRALATAGIDPARRAETLTVADYVRLAHVLAETTRSKY